MDASRVISLLGLEPHPEGGYFRETFRDAAGSDGRAVSTAIYFLLEAGQISRWHRVDAAEVWHWYAGAPLRLSVVNSDRTKFQIILGPALADGERPQVVIPSNAWQQAESLGRWTLTGCTVAPGFTFSGFELAADDFEP